MAPDPDNHKFSMTDHINLAMRLNQIKAVPRPSPAGQEAVSASQDKRRAQMGGGTMEGANFTEPQKETSFHFQLPLPPKSFSLTSAAHSCMESSADST